MTTGIETLIMTIGLRIMNIDNNQTFGKDIGEQDLEGANDNWTFEKVPIIAL